MTAVTRLYENMLITWEYGIQVPERNIAFCQTMLPQVKEIAKCVLRIVRRISKASTKSWPRTLIWSLRDVKASLFQLVTCIEMAERYMKQRNYPTMAEYIAEARDYAAEIVDYLDEYNGS